MNSYPSPSHNSVSSLPLQLSSDVVFTKSPPSSFPYHHRHRYCYFPTSSPPPSTHSTPFLLPSPYPPFPSPSQSSPSLSHHYYPMDHQSSSAPPTMHHHQHYSHSSPRSHPSSSSTAASVVPSPPSSCPSSSAVSNHLRFEVILEAPTAAAQKIEDAPLTYLNKGQYYTINLSDSEQYDGEIASTITIMFHDESHRKVAVDFWKFWMSQQKDQDSARAIDIDTGRSNGVFNVQCQFFDSISFRWNGKAGASICLRFHFLSTDFSRIKGVKGIPLRLHIATKPIDPSAATADSDEIPAERSYCQIKLFRDKGAERKNKDDARHIEKQLEKLRGKNGEPHPLWLAYLQTQPYTVFCAVPSSSPVPSISASALTHSGLQQHQQQQQRHNHNHHRSSPYPGGNGIAGPAGAMIPSSCNIMSPSLVHTPLQAYGGGVGSAVLGMKRDHQDAISMFASSSSQAPSNISSYFMQQPIVDVDPNYVPQQRRRFAKLSLFVKLPNETLHRAVYLDQLSAEDLKEKLACKLGSADGKEQHPIKDFVRCVANKDNVIVRVDDALVSGMVEEQVMEVESRSNEDGTTTLVLHY